METKLWFAIASAVIGVIAFIPYIRDMFLRRTRPHAYTWLIWMITQGIGAAGVWHGGGEWGALTLIVWVVFVSIVFVGSFWFGTKDITRSDTVVLFAAIGAILVWVVLDQPLLSVLFATGIDMLGYVPSFRKSYADPWGETLSAWGLFVLADLLAIFALAEYSILTTVYLGALTIANAAILLFCMYRRTRVLEPAQRS